MSNPFTKVKSSRETDRPPLVFGATSSSGSFSFLTGRRTREPIRTKTTTIGASALGSINLRAKRTRGPEDNDNGLPAAKRSSQPTADRSAFVRAASAKPLQWHSQIYKPAPAPKPVARPYYPWKAKDFPNAAGVKKKKPESTTSTPNIILNPPGAQPATTTGVAPNSATAKPQKPVELEKKGATTFHRWAELPTELQLNVLRHRLIFDKPIKSNLHGVYACRAVTPLAQTNKAMNALTLQMYYSENRFVVSRVPKIGSPVWSYPNPAVAHWVQYLEIKVKVNAYCCSSIERMMVGRSDWRFLLRPNEDIANRDGFAKYKDSEDDIIQWTKNATRWQSYFHKLKELKICLNSQDNSEHCFHQGILLNDDDEDGEELHSYPLENEVKHAKIVVKSKKVEVVCEPSARLCNDNHEAAGRDTCQEVLKATIKDMIQLRGDDEDTEDGETFPDVEFQQAETKPKKPFVPPPPKSLLKFVPGEGWVYELGAPLPETVLKEAKCKRAQEEFERKKQDQFERKKQEEEKLVAAQEPPPKKRRGHRGGKKKRRKGKKENAIKRTKEGVERARLARLREREARTTQKKFTRVSYSTQARVKKALNLR